ncbi:MAG: hypothetical protein H7840_05640 [Alphaproteobacteria bacterium]
MVLVRLLGWLLVAGSVLMVSADIVLALSPHAYSSIANRDIWTLLAGSPPTFGLNGMTPADSWTAMDTLARMGAAIMNWPAWTVMGPLGIALILGARNRGHHHHHHHHRPPSRFDSP